MKNVREHWAGIQLGLQAAACNRGAAVEADAIGEQQPKRTRSGAAAEADTSGEHAAAAEADTSGEHAAAAEADTSGEHAAAAEVGAIGEQLEVDANGEQQLKQMQSSQGAAADSKRMQAASSGRNRGASGRNRGAAALHRELSGTGLLTVGERGGSS